MLRKIKKIINEKKTLLGVGPMSKNCVISAINVSNNYNIPIFLIASRRQIDSEIFGGGYVNNWDTKEFVKFVKKNDKKKNIIISRDHGGPWQNSAEVENKISWKNALIFAKKSFECDIDNDFKIIHIDTSKDIEKKISKKIALERFFELLEHCIYYASTKKKKIYFEIGTEEQNGSTNTTFELENTLINVSKFCSRNKIELPLFVVIQAGTKVLEMKNVGSFESPLRIENELPVEIQLPKMIEICNRFGIFMKEHNGDYLTNESLSWHPKLGIHAVNVAPEFGVCETKALITVLKRFNLKKYLDNFLEISFNSKKWKKWMMKDSVASDFDKSIISGHYVFSNNDFIFLKEKVKNFLYKKNVDLDKYLQSQIECSIIRYLRCFRIVK